MSQRMCIVVHARYPISRPRAVRQARAALAAGFEVDVVALRGPDDSAREVIDDVQVYRLPLSHRRSAGLPRVLFEYVGFALLASIYVLFMSVRRRYRVIQINSPPDFLVVAGLLPRLFGARLIVDIQDFSSHMFAMRFPATRRFGAFERVLLAVERVSLRSTDAIVTIHEPYKRELVGRGALPEKITVVMNSVDEHLLPSRPPRVAANNPANSFKVVYHGSLTPPYGVEVLIEASALLAVDVPALRLQIYGEGDAAVALHDRVRDLGIADRVDMTERYIPHVEVLQAVRTASVGVIPNLPMKLNDFALPTKLLEFVAMGVPVVTGDLATIREHFSKDEVLFFQAGDAADLCSALLAVARDPLSAAARSRAARRRYESYRWAPNAVRYTNLLTADPKT